MKPNNGYIKPSVFPISAKPANNRTPLNINIESGSKEHSKSNQDPDELEEDKGTKISCYNYRLTYHC